MPITQDRILILVDESLTAHDAHRALREELIRFADRSIINAESPEITKAQLIADIYAMSRVIKQACFRHDVPPPYHAMKEKAHFTPKALARNERARLKAARSREATPQPRLDYESKQFIQAQLIDHQQEEEFKRFRQEAYPEVVMNLEYTTAKHGEAPEPDSSAIPTRILPEDIKPEVVRLSGAAGRVPAHPDFDMAESAPSTGFLPESSD